jgi:daunorubicin resistance ABC transporter ATP-binding subunit
MLFKHLRESGRMGLLRNDSGDAIVVEGLRKRFGQVVALDGIDFVVPAGTVLGLLGPNGAGKTTTVRVLTTTAHPDGGIARVLGIDVVQHPAAVRARIGLAGQFAAVDENLTGRENLRMVGRLAHLPRPDIASRSRDLLERFDLSDAADRPVRTYSGGMRRRLDLAAALVHRPPVLFLDEPTTGLDPQSRAGVWELIGELVDDGATVLLTTQYLEEADRLADRIVLVDDGRVIAEGTAPELKSRFGSTVIEIGFPNEAGALRARAVLARIALGEPEQRDSMVRVPVADGPRALMDALRALDADGLTPVTLVVREPSLDDVFLTLTGRHCETEAPAADSTRGAA